MAQVAFSHQFSHRWSNAPQSVKDALIQEFEDIVELLEPETDLESFQFSVPDLHAHIEAINAEVAAEQEAARIEAEKLEAERLEAETAELEAEEAERLQQSEQQSERQQIEAMEAERLQLEHEANEQQRVFDAEEAAHLAQMQQQEAEPNSEDIDNLQQTEEVIGTETEAELEADEVVAEEASEPQQGEAEQQNSATEPAGSELEAPEQQQPIPEPSETSSSFAFDNSHPGADLDADFVKELESRIDDYLSEQLANMSEDLKSWLRDQVANRLNSK